MQKEKVLRGEIYLCDLGEPVGSVQGGIRPVLVVQNNYGNIYSSTVIVVPLTTKNKNSLVTHVEVKAKEMSTVLCEQIRTVRKSDLGKRMGYLGWQDMVKIDHALIVSLGIK